MAINIYRFGKIENISSFTDNTSNNIYFPISDSSEIPSLILDKTEEMIRCMLHDYEVEKGYILDLSKLCLCARLVAFINKEGKAIKGISVIIFGIDENECIEDEYRIVEGDALYEPFREYFMEQLEKSLFRS